MRTINFFQHFDFLSRMVTIRTLTCLMPFIWLSRLIVWLLCLNMCDWLTMARSCGLVDDHVAENEYHVAEIDVSWLILYLMNYCVEQQVNRMVNYGYYRLKCMAYRAHILMFDIKMSAIYSIFICRKLHVINTQHWLISRIHFSACTPKW